MSEQIVVKELAPLSQVKQVYSGLPGCACGCRGTYFPRDKKVALSKGYWTDADEVNKEDGWKKSNRMIKRVYNLFLKHLAEGKVYSWKGSVNKFVCLDLHENRTYTIYYEED